LELSRRQSCVGGVLRVGVVGGVGFK
jgi:hypothetical protein